MVKEADWKKSFEEHVKGCGYKLTAVDKMFLRIIENNFRQINDLTTDQKEKLFGKGFAGGGGDFVFGSDVEFYMELQNEEGAFDTKLVFEERKKIARNVYVDLSSHESLIQVGFNDVSEEAFTKFFTNYLVPKVSPKFILEKVKDNIPSDQYEAIASCINRFGEKNFKKVLMYSFYPGDDSVRRLSKNQILEPSVPQTWKETPSVENGNLAEDSIKPKFELRLKPQKWQKFLENYYTFLKEGISEGKKDGFFFRSVSRHIHFSALPEMKLDKKMPCFEGVVSGVLYMVDCCLPLLSVKSQMEQKRKCDQVSILGLGSKDVVPYSCSSREVFGQPYMVKCPLVYSKEHLELRRIKPGMENGQMFGKDNMYSSMIAGLAVISTGLFLSTKNEYKSVIESHKLIDFESHRPLYSQDIGGVSGYTKRMCDNALLKKVWGTRVLNELSNLNTERVVM